MSYMVLIGIYIRWDMFYVFFYYLTKVGQFVPNINNKRCPETDALLVFKDLLKIEEWLRKSMIPMSKATPAFCLLDFITGCCYVFI